MLDWAPDCDEAMLCIAVLARDADGRVHPDETALMARRLKAEYGRLESGGEMMAMSRLAITVRSEGRKATLGLLRGAFDTAEKAREAVLLALQVARADQDFDPREEDLLYDIGNAFGLQEDDITMLVTT